MANLSDKVRTIGLIGGGVIGSAWAARLLINGLNVNLYDPDPGVPQRLDRVLENALHAYRRMTLAPVSIRGSLKIVDTVREAVADADFVQESGPERIDIKKALFREIADQTHPQVIIASSSSGLQPSEMQLGVRHPERVIVGHPFNPVYLLPLLEIVGGSQTSTETKERARDFYASVGMHPLVLRKEVDAFIADRLMEALWREALHLLNEDVATADELDQAIAYGPGIRWAFMGPFLTYRIAGGEGGMRHFMAQFGPTLKWPWTRFDGPELTDQLLDKITSQSDIQAAGRTIDELERKRDDCIVAVMQGLRVNNNASGKVLIDYEEKLYRISHQDEGKTAGGLIDDFSKPLCLHDSTVPPEWVDYNNHMSESSYLQAIGDASDALFRFIGVNESYHKRGFSYFTVETHLIHHSEISAGKSFYFTTQVLNLDEKRLHIFHSMYAGADDRLLATGEQMLLHVNTVESKVCPVDKQIMARLNDLFRGHQQLEKPANAGRAVGGFKK